jgi:hypothetical protein
MDRKFRFLIICTILIAAAMLTGCTRRVMWSGNSYPGNMEAKFQYFNGEEKTPFNLKQGDSVTFTYDSKVEKGTLSIKVVSPDNKDVLELESNKQGTKDLKAETGGKYKVVIAGAEAGGSYDVKWKINKD